MISMIVGVHFCRSLMLTVEEIEWKSLDGAGTRAKCTGAPSVSFHHLDCTLLT